MTGKCLRVAILRKECYNRFEHHKHKVDGKVADAIEYIHLPVCLYIRESVSQVLRYHSEILDHFLICRNEL